MTDRPATFFENAAAFAAWLAEHHDTAPELWMELRKRHVSPRGLTWEEAVTEALCWGWIDSKSERIDDDARRQRWTPRRKGSTWSRINIAAVERLSAEGRMQPSGLAAFADRREDRSGTYTFEQGELTLTDEQEAAIHADPAAAAFWGAATPGYRKICTHWVQSAKREDTRVARLATLVADCAAGRLIPSQRYGTEPKWVARAAAAASAARQAGS